MPAIAEAIIARDERLDVVASEALSGSIHPLAEATTDAVLKALGAGQEPQGDLGSSEIGSTPFETAATEIASTRQKQTQELRDRVSEISGIDLSSYSVVVDSDPDRNASRTTPMEIVIHRNVESGNEARAEIRIFPNNSAVVRDSLAALVVAGHELAHAVDEQLDFPSQKMGEQLEPILRGFEKAVQIERSALKIDEGTWVSLEVLAREAWTDGLGLKLAIRAGAETIKEGADRIASTVEELKDHMLGSEKDSLLCAGRMARAAAFIKGSAEAVRSLGLGEAAVAIEPMRGEIVKELANLIGEERAGQLLVIMDYAFRSGSTQAAGALE